MAKKKIEPLNRGQFGLASHRYQQFDALVRAGTTKEQLIDPELWVNVAPSVNPGDEIRARADDDSFVALLHVTYSVGNQVRLQVVYFSELGEVDYDKMHADSSPYTIKQRGQQKWCIMQDKVAEPIKSLIPTRLEAERELDDLKRALAA